MRLNLIVPLWGMTTYLASLSNLFPVLSPAEGPHPENKAKTRKTVQFRVRVIGET